MVWRVIKYEWKRSLPLHLVWAAIAAALAIPARLGIFSLTDMPLFYLMFFASVGVMLYRYYCSMHGAEAAFLFTMDLSSGKQMLARYCSAGIWSILSALMIGLVLRLQGEDLGLLLRNLSLPLGIVLTAEAAFSAFLLFMMVSAALTISNIRPFSGRPVLWFVIIGTVMVGANRILPGLTETFLPACLVITEEGTVQISTVSNLPASLSFSLNTLAWNAAFAVVIMLCIPALVRKKLLLTR